MNISNYHVLNSKILVIGQNEKYLKILLNFNKYMLCFKWLKGDFI